MKGVLLKKIISVLFSCPRSWVGFFFKFPIENLNFLHEVWIFLSFLNFLHEIWISLSLSFVYKIWISSWLILSYPVQFNQYYLEISTIRLFFSLFLLFSFFTGILLPKLFWPTVRKFLAIEKKFWNSRLKAENLQSIWDHYNNLFKQWKVRTIFGNRMIF